MIRRCRPLCVALALDASLGALPATSAGAATTTATPTLVVKVFDHAAPAKLNEMHRIH